MPNKTRSNHLGLNGLNLRTLDIHYKRYEVYFNKQTNILSNAQKKEIGWQPEFNFMAFPMPSKYMLYLHK